MRRYTPPALSLIQPDFGVLRKAQRGDERAFSIIVRTYETPVFNYVLRLVGDRALAEDLTQEVFIRVFQGLPKFSLRSKFTTWLFQVTKNRVLDELRASERRPRALVAIEDVPPLEVVDVRGESLPSDDPACFQTASGAPPGTSWPRGNRGAFSGHGASDDRHAKRFRGSADLRA